MPYLTPTSPGGTAEEESSSVMKGMVNGNKQGKTSTLRVPDGLPNGYDPSNTLAFSIQPPTPDKTPEADPFHHAAQPTETRTVSKPTSTVDFPTASPSGSSAADAISSILQRQQTLPEVRSPPRRFKHFGSSSLWKDEPTEGPGESSESAHIGNESNPSSQQRPRGRPRLFGFTEMVPDAMSNPSSSAESSRNGSRNSSPTRSPGLEMIPRSNRRASAMKTSDRNSPPQSAVETPVASPTPVVAPPSTAPRRQSVVRSHSEANVKRSSMAISHRVLARVAPKASLSTRTSAQRNETALKLDLNGLNTKNAEPSSISPALPSPLIRKKSGEVLKPSLKSVSSYSDVGQALNTSPGIRSLPSTPSCPKFVHFDTHLERVKLFLHDQKPEIVSRDASPIDCVSTSEGEEYPFPATDEEEEGKKVLEIRLPNFPTQHELDADLYIESLFLDDDRKSLKGVIRVKNISFSKWVAVRFTFDWWSTTNETSATYKESIQGGKYDRFQFTLKLHDMLHKLEDKTLFIAVRYTTDGREIWDNNNGQNYEVKFVKKAVSSQRSLTPLRPNVSHGSGLISPGMGRSVGGRASQWDVNGKRDDRMSDLRAHLSRLASGDDHADNDDGHTPIVLRGQSLSPVRRPGGLPRRKESSNTSGDLKPPTSPGYGPSSPLAQRYDFSYSLQGARGGKKTSPSSRNVDLPSSPTGFTFPTDSATPSMDFYSPQLNHLKDLPPVKGPSVPADVPSPANRNAADRISLQVPQVAVHEPSPPLDYFARSAPSATVGPDRQSPVPASTELPRMYSPLPSFMNMALEKHESPTKSALTISDRDSSNERLDSVDDSPPSISHSTASSITSGDSPRSPSQPELPRAASIDHLASLDYNSILEKFCWGGGNPGKFAELSVNPFGAYGSGLDHQHSSSESDIPKYAIDHLETYTGTINSPPPTDRSITPKARIRNGKGQEKEKGDSFFKAVSRSLQSSPVQSPLPTPGGRTPIAS